MGYPTKIQLISRKKVADQYYINFPTAVAEALEFQKGEIIEWIIENKANIIAHRPVVPPDLQSQPGVLPYTGRGELVPEVGRDVLVLRVGPITHGGRLPVVVAERSRSGTPAGIVVGRRAPGAAQISPEVVVFPGGAGGDLLLPRQGQFRFGCDPLTEQCGLYEYDLSGFAGP